MNTKKALKLFAFVIAFLAMIALFIVALATYGDVQPVEVTVDEATLGRLSLAANATAASLAYNLSVAVAVRNPNFLARAWRVAPLSAEVRIGGEPFALLRLAGAETADTERIPPKSSRMFRGAAAAASAPVGSDGVAAFRRESGVGVFRLEVTLTGAFKYDAGVGRHTTTVRCPLRIPLATSATATAFAAFERTLPQKCQ